MNFRRFFAIVVLLISTSTLSATNDPLRPTPTWNIQFKSAILWQQITTLGNLVINTQDGLYGIDGQTGQRTWEIKGMGNIPAESYQPLPNTFFAEILLPNAIVIIDPYDGRIIGNTKKAGFKDVMAKNLLYESGTLLVYGFKDDLQAYLSVFDVKTGNELWSSNEIFQKSKSKLGGLLNTLQVASELDNDRGTAAFDLIEITRDQFIIATANGLFNISTRSGQVKWQAELPTPAGAVSTTSSSKLIQGGQSSGQFYFAKSNYIMAYNIQDGGQVWNKVTKINGLVNEVIPYGDGLILLPEIDPNNNMFGVKLSYVNAKTGEKSWGNKNKGLKLPGSVVDYQWVENGLVLSMQSDEKSFLNILDPQRGTFKFSDHLKIKGALDYTEMTPAGLLYFTSATKYGKGEVNIFDLKNGNPKFSKSITAKFGEGSTQNTLLRDFKGQLAYVYTNDGNALYEINLHNGGLRLLREGIKLEGKESVTSLEVREQGILLSSHQNVVMIDFTGKGLFQKYYPAPTEPGII
ncbi:MAG: PQQ-binding-like beta-propeller repeat protein, partial [Cyclobacteriaceae bacterium]|nr:PQQ-binding-like beta-propeller repeat protein [Cyclobacteriaceae bacterium]